MTSNPSFDAFILKRGEMKVTLEKDDQGIPDAGIFILQKVITNS